MHGLVSVYQSRSGVPPLDQNDKWRDAASTRFKKFTYAEIIARDKANLDIFWLKDDSLEDSENLPLPAELAAEIVESLERSKNFAPWRRHSNQLHKSSAQKRFRE